MATLHVVGVRHHSPACARLAEHVIRGVRPRHVLVEGPADMNERIGELALPHELPVAIFSYMTREGRTRASWSPFCAYSPEWVALRAAAEVGAAARFMDLPAWDDAFHAVRNRYADRDRWTRAVDALCAKIGVDDFDALWDHLFEQPASPDDLGARLEAYFAEVRSHDGGDGGDVARERFMARAVAWAMADAERHGGDVVAVCGGYHKPAIERAWRAEDGRWPELTRAEPGAKVGSYLVPYSFRRLDSFTGYESGMPSPAYYQAAWDDGPDEAAERMLWAAVDRLRRKKQRISAADAIAASALARGLGRLRGHRALARVDVLDGLAGALVKDALDVPLPWSRRGTLLPRSEPLLVEVVSAFSGDRTGALAPGTPRPPLLDDVRAELEAHGLAPAKPPRRAELRLDDPAGRAASRVLHRLRVLGIPGVTREAGPAWVTDPVLAERWVLEATLDADAALIEAAALGATLESAAAAKLEQQLLEAAGRLAPLAALVGDAVFVGIGTLASRVLADVGRAVGAEPSLGALGFALGRLVGLYRHGALLGAAESPVLRELIDAAYDRGLWLFEESPAGGPGEIAAAVALRDALRVTGLDPTRAHGVMERRALDAAAPPALRGAALGLLWATGGLADGAAPSRGGPTGASERPEERAARAVRASALPATLGDFLSGLFAVAREEVAGTLGAGRARSVAGAGDAAATAARRASGVLGAVDAAIAGLDAKDFLVALPALRLAFTWFPPAEREAIARSVLSLHEVDPGAARTFLRLEVPAAELARAAALEAELAALATRFGLDDAEAP